jgi:hypothetical protein
MTDTSTAARRPANLRPSRETLLLGVIDRLEQVVEAETTALRQLKPIDTTPFAIQKSQGLLELARLLRQGDIDSASDRLRDRIAVLRQRLDENRAALELHLNASREVFDTVAKALNDAESDRTYPSASGRPKGREA